MKKSNKKNKRNRQRGTGLQAGENIKTVRVYSVNGQPMPLIRQNKTKIMTLNFLTKPQLNH
jgi:hypothetical protein